MRGTNMIVLLMFATLSFSSLYMLPHMPYGSLLCVSAGMTGKSWK